MNKQEELTPEKCHKVTMEDQRTGSGGTHWNIGQTDIEMRQDTDYIHTQALITKNSGRE